MEEKTPSDSFLIFTKGTMENSAILYGIIYMESCGRHSVYIEVQNYLDWIHQNMKNRKGRVLKENIDPPRFLERFLAAGRSPRQL